MNFQNLNIDGFVPTLNRMSNIGIKLHPYDIAKQCLGTLFACNYTIWEHFFEPVEMETITYEFAFSLSNESGSSVGTMDYVFSGFEHALSTHSSGTDRKHQYKGIT